MICLLLIPIFHFRKIHPSIALSAEIAPSSLAISLFQGPLRSFYLSSMVMCYKKRIVLLFRSSQIKQRPCKNTALILTLSTQVLMTHVKQPVTNSPTPFPFTMANPVATAKLIFTGWSILLPMHGTWPFHLHILSRCY